MNAVYELAPDIDDWPLRIKDTIAHACLRLEGASYDTEFLDRLILAMKKEIASDAYQGDRGELERRVAEYEAQLRANRSRQPAPSDTKR
jgi:hypothetical protein